MTDETNSGMKIEFHDIFGIIFSFKRNGKKKKALTIITAGLPNIGQNETYVDLRLYLNGISTDNGLYLNEDEYKWMTDQLKKSIHSKIEYPNDGVDMSLIGTTNLKISSYKTLLNARKVKISQVYKGLKRQICLNHEDIDQIINSYSSMDEIVGVIEDYISNFSI